MSIKKLENYFILDLPSSEKNQKIDIFTYVPNISNIEEKNLFLDSIESNLKLSFINNIYLYKENDINFSSNLFKKEGRIKIINKENSSFNDFILKYLTSSYSSEDSIILIINPYSNISENCERIKSLNMSKHYSIMCDFKDKTLYSIYLHSSNLIKIKKILKDKDLSINNLFGLCVNNKIKTLNIKNLNFIKHYEYNENLLKLNAKNTIKTVNITILNKILNTRYIINNNLCVCFLVSRKEIENKSAFRCFYNFINNSSKKFKLDFFVFSDKNYPQLSQLKSFESSPQVNSINIISLNIKNRDNIYKNSSSKKPNRMPELGLSSGPNQLFFKSSEYIKNLKYKNFLILESDCLPASKYWFDYLNKECSKNNFLILGSKYKGQKISYSNGFFADYLNGVAIYKNSQELHDILRSVKKYIIFSISKKAFNQKLNYDTAICHFLKNLKLEIYNKYIKHTDLISNCSFNSDSSYGKDFFINKNPKTKILHLKNYLKFDYKKSIVLFFPCTEHEISSGKLKQTLMHYFENLIPSLKYSFDLVFIFNNIKKINLDDINHFNNNININSITIHSLKLSKSEDLFLRPWDPNFKMPQRIPEFGLSNGPNISFYKSISFLKRKFKKAKYFFLAEEDSMPVKNFWFDEMVRISNSKNLIIGGSKYKGNNLYHKSAYYKDHLNGIALYSNSRSLQRLILLSKNYLKNKFSEKNLKVASLIDANPMNFFIHYDIAFDLVLQKNKHLNNFYRSKLVNLDEITNYSDPIDISVKLGTILKKYPKTVILHKKKVSDKEIYQQIYKNSFSIK